MTLDRIQEKIINYKMVLNKLQRIVDEPEVNDYRLDALIQRFEFTYELAWKLIKAWLEYNGIEARTPRDCFREAFTADLIRDGEGWMNMLVDRNLISHTYDEKDARKIGKNIEEHHYALLAKLITEIEERLQ
jgi:nucleotidyltransferase substrate binding protein (TIGR01987 family)